MHSAFTYTASDVAAADEWTSFQLATWGVRTSFVRTWLEEATPRLPAGATARVVLDYDPREQVLTFDVWAEEFHVYSVDDLL